MRSKLGIVFMLLGASLVLGAMALFFHNQQEDMEAEAFAQDILPALQNEIREIRDNPPSETIPQETKPAELLEPEDLIMTEKIINGYGYIGYLTISELDLNLPVMGSWDSRRLQIAPCRFTGTLRGGDLVIMAHNYNSHFGRLSKLSVGSEIQFTDMDGTDWYYQVVAIDLLQAEAVEEMTAGEYDLTLFTCATNRSQRVTIRCDKVEM